MERITGQNVGDRTLEDLAREIGQIEPPVFPGIERNARAAAGRGADRQRARPVQAPAATAARDHAAWSSSINARHCRATT